MSTSAISGKIIFYQNSRVYLDANKRSNSLVFDTTNNTLLYSPSGTTYYEFFPGQQSATSGVSAVTWTNVSGKPTASTNTSGVLTSSDWNTFNNKSSVSALASTSTSGYLTSSDWNKFNVKADVSAIPTSAIFSTSAYFFQNPDPVLSIFSGNTTSAALGTISAAQELPYWNAGYRTKKFLFSGPSSGTYQSTVVFYGAAHNTTAFNVSDTISATISNSAPSVSGFYTNKFTKWSGTLSVDSGTIPVAGVSASVEG
jgi:hypothetical protein